MLRWWWRRSMLSRTNLLRPPPSSVFFFSSSSSSSSATTEEEFATLLRRACSGLHHIRQTHAFMIHRGFNHHSLSLARFIDTCSALGFPDYGISLFTHNTTQPTTTRLCNSGIRALSLSPAPSSAAGAVQLFNLLRLFGLEPDSYSFPFVLKAVVRLSDLGLGRGVHCQAARSGLDSDVHVVTALLEMYSKFGCSVDARRLFDEMLPLRRSMGLWNAMVSACAKAGDVDTAGLLFDQMPEKNVISWTAVIAGYARVGRSSEALAVFLKMLLGFDEEEKEDQRLKPDGVTMLAALVACADLGALQLGERIHRYIDEHRLLRNSVPLNNALIDMYAKSGNIGMAVDLFEKMECPRRSVVTWTTMIDGLARHGLGGEALQLFSRMERGDIKPNDVTFVAMLRACCHAGLVEIGLGCFNRMNFRHGIQPRIEHYGCIVDLLGRAGYIQRALELVSKMPFQASAAIWGSILSASRIHGDAELAEHAQSHLAELEPHHSGNYMNLSNAYAAVGRWNEAGVVRSAMRESGVHKTRGGSCIELNHEVHEFIAGDMSHAQSDCILDVLDQIHSQLKMITSSGLETSSDDSGQSSTSLAILGS